MANNTIYPYGTDGQLPSSIGIINDLTTGGADKALSAEMGVALNDKMTAYDMVDLSQITQRNYSPGTSGLWNATSGKHKVIPATPGSEWRIKASGYGGWYLWLTSSYTVPTTSTQVPYCTGTTRMWANEGTYYYITAPADAAYLCVCPVDGAGNACAWQVGEKTDGYAFLTGEDVVDNLSSTQAENPLSAKQGKRLGEVMGGVIPFGVTKVAYDGPRVVTPKQRYVGTALAANISAVAMQGAACYGDYLFCFTANNTTCWIFDLSDGSLVQTITIPAEDRGFVSDCHCNTVNFGTEFYDPSDEFPLLYVSTGYSDGTDTGALVYRIVNTGGIYSLNLVQTFKFPGTSWTEFITAGEMCYVLAQNSYYRFFLPKLSEGDVTFDYSQALGETKITDKPAWYNGSRGQGELFVEGKIYYVSGVPSSEKLLFIVINLETGNREVEIDLGTLGITREPEALFVWGQRLCVSFHNRTEIYALYFE